jgi:poly(hydroxyalkanoate) depolymerase family esterase
MTRTGTPRPPQQEPGRVARGTFLSHPYQNRSYKLYVPSGYHHETPLPLLVMLHGCNQSPDDFATATEMNEYAEQHTFLVVYPAQPRSANGRRCWNWFQKRNQERGTNEPGEIVGIINQVQRDYAVDSRRIYAAGLSAGAAMCVTLGATYPDIFAAIGVCSGLQYQAATGVLKGFLVMFSGGPDPRVQGERAYNAMGSYRRTMPVIVFHGTADRAVASINADQVVLQWLHTNHLASHGLQAGDLVRKPAEVTSGTVPGGRNYTEYSYKDEHGKVILKKYLVEGMQHRWSGGSPAGTYTDPQGPKASALIVEFFWQHSMPPALAPEAAPLEAAPPPPEAPGLWRRIVGGVRGLGRRVARLLRRDRG